jgi:hypothetical protein
MRVLDPLLSALLDKQAPLFSQVSISSIQEKIFPCCDGIF